MSRRHTSLTRRSFLQLLGAGTGGLLLGVNATGCASLKAQDLGDIFAERGAFEPSLFLSVHSDGRIVVAAKHSEMGQGILTGTATLLAEELEVSLVQIEVVQAHKPGFGMQMTGGSMSTASIFMPVRKAGASAREMLRAAAATKWGVPVEDCIAKSGSIHHANGKQSLSYGDLASLAVQQPIPKSPSLKSSSDFTLIGKEDQGGRVDALDKSIGRAIFGTDVSIPDKVCAYVLRAPVMGGHAETVVFDEALKEPGVLDVVSFERGVAVLAEKYWQAKRASSRVQITWSAGQVEGLDTTFMAEAARLRSLQPGDHTIKDVGNVEKALAQHTRQIELQYEHPYLSHATMEPQNCTVLLDGDTVKVWVPTQAPTMVVGVLHQYLGIPKENIEVEMTMLGGGFGRRACVDFVIEAAQIARLRPGVPIQVAWSREDDMTMGYYRPQGACRMIGAVDENGEIVAIHSHLVSQLIFPDIGEQLDGLFPKFIPEKMRKKLAYASTGYLSNTSLMGFVEGGDIATCKYTLPNFRYDFTPIHVNVPVTAWRSVAHSYSTFIMETFVDHLAVLGKTDPLETKRRLLAEHPRYLAVLDAVVKESDWGKPIDDGWGRGIAVSEFAQSVVAQVVEAGIVNNEIVVRHVTCAVDCGIVINPDVVRAQIESGIIYGLSMMTEKIEFKDGVVQQRNFDTFPVMRMNRVPVIHSIVLQSDNKPTGIGEISLPPVNAAVSNAIYAATGVRLTKMPLQDAWNEHQRGLTAADSSKNSEVSL